MRLHQTQDQLPQFRPAMRKKLIGRRAYTHESLTRFLWLLTMAGNLLFTAVGIPVRDAAACVFTVNGTNHSFSTFQEDIVDSTTVYYLGIAVYVVIVLSGCVH